MTVYLAHATSFCGGVWRPVVEELEDLGPVTWDFAGHGGGPPLSPPVDWKVFADQVLAETEPGGVGVGHSMGGAAMLMAQLEDPSRFRALLLVEPILFPGPHGRKPHPLVEVALRRKACFASRDAARAYFEARAAFAGWHPAALDGYLECGLTGEDPVTLACVPELEAEIYRGWADHDTFERMQKVSVPVLILVGAESDTLSPESARAQARQFPRAGLEIVDGAGHFLPMERPRLVAARVRRLAEAVSDVAGERRG